MTTSLTDFRHAFKACQFSATRNQQITLKEQMQRMADVTAADEASDTYGSGELIENFEAEIAGLLGKEAAVFLPSGTMAQPIALKIWAEQQRTPYVAMHSTSHVLLHEHNGYQSLYDLNSVTLGAPHRVPTLDDLKEAILNPLAAVLLELPMREIGGQLPDWDDLVAQTSWLKAQGIRVHMDGARLWQCPAAYDKSLAEISALFDSIYVSFYKDLGGIAGACLVGDKDLIDRAKIWIRRAGGNLYSLAPYIIAARDGLQTHLPDIPSRREKAIWLAEKLNAIPQLSTWPTFPQTNMFRLRIDGDAEQILPKLTETMQQTGVSLITPPYQVDDNHFMCELTIGDAFAQRPLPEWVEHIERLREALV